MRAELSADLTNGQRLRFTNHYTLELFFSPEEYSRLVKNIETLNSPIEIIAKESDFFGEVYLDNFVKFDLLPGAYILLENKYYAVLDPGDDGYNPSNAPMTPPTQGVKGAVVGMRPFNRDIDGVGTRVAVNSREVYDWSGEELFLMGTVERLTDDKNSKVNYDGHKPVFTREVYYIVFRTDEDVKKVRTFDIDKDGEGSRVAVLGTRMPRGNDVTKMYYGTIKSTFQNSSIEIEFDTDVSSGISSGLPIRVRRIILESEDLIIIDGSATKNDDNSFFLKSIADVLLSTTSKTNLNRIEVVESALAENFGADGKEAIEYALESKESFNLFKEILEGLGQMEARRLGVSVKPKIETLTPAPAVPKAPRKKKEPVSEEPMEIITPDTSVFQNEDELSSILDEFLT